MGDPRVQMKVVTQVYLGCNVIWSDVSDTVVDSIDQLSEFDVAHRKLMAKDAVLALTESYGAPQDHKRGPKPKK